MLEMARQTRLCPDNGNTDCGACMHACVVNAIYPDAQVPRSSAEFVHINESWFRHKTGVRKRVREIGRETGMLPRKQ